MLRRLRGRPHTVLSGVHDLDCRTGLGAAGVSRPRVRMRRFSDARRESYRCSRERLDQAGAYAIEGKGAALVARFSGPDDDVVGLPPHLVRRLLGEVVVWRPRRGAVRGQA